MISWFDFGPVHYRRWRQIQIVWSLSVCVLLAATWRLWAAQEVFPQVPLIGGTASCPPMLHWVTFALLLVTALAVLVIRYPNGYQRLVLRSFLVVALMAIVLDQHRLQPWFYEAILFALVMSCFSPTRAVPLLRAILVSIYLFSALGKLDYQFLHTVGPQFVAAGGQLLGISIVEWPTWLTVLLSIMFPVVELLGGVGLLIKRFRKMAIMLLVFMHVGLLLVLGPLGLNHRLGVLLWNVSFIFQVVLLFGQQPIADSAATIEKSQDYPGVVRFRYLFLVLLLLPLLEPWGLLDHWLCWGLYSPRNSRVTFEIYQLPGERLPAEIEPYVRPSRFREGMVELRMDQWSLKGIQVPIYPQARFQLGVAAAVIKEAKLQAFVITVQSMSGRFSGDRKEQVIKSLDQLEEALEGFWVNARPTLRES